MEPLFAYIDPGSGSLMIQAFIAMLVAVPIFFRHQIGRAIRAVRGGSDVTATATATVDQEDTPPGA